jgi:DNA-directed RNA polymerase specialized sigma24 family protein
VEIELLDLDAAVERERRAAQHRSALPRLCQRRVRDPADMQDLLHYSLIGGAIDATRDPFEGDTA